ncbi:MAG: adenylate/guanylate cyclase domain-containing protein [Elusimicrobiota bacterium]|nr:adenylate/guanylate cyclase domain-containing protein [Elusimicrobiota bacterium]
MNLRYKFTAALVAVLCLEIASFGLAAFLKQKSALRQQLESRAEVLIRHLAGTGKTCLLTQNELAMQAVVRDLRSVPEIAYAIILDNRGKVFASDPMIEKGESLNGPADNAIGLEGSLLLRYISQAGRPVLDATLPITFNAGGKNLRLGTARLGLSLKDLQEAIERQRSDYVNLTAGFALLGLALALLLGNMLTARLMNLLKEKVRMEKYVSLSTMQLIRRISDSAKLKLGGERRYVVILFSDIRGFTEITESSDPEEVVGFLNIYLNLQTEVISHRGGAVDKFVGDEIMAIFTGVDAELNAARAAVEIQSFIAALNAFRRKSGKRQVLVGIGINAGEVIMGNIGARTQMDFTVIGDPVNTAARLCGAATPGKIIISQTVYSALAGACVADRLPPLAVKGKARPLDVYQLLTIEHSAREYLRREVAIAASYALAETPGALRPAVIRDIGLGGCYLETSQPLVVGTHLQLTATEKALDRLQRLPASVRYFKKEGKKYLIGLAFTDPPLETCEQVAEYVYTVEAGNEIVS